MNQDQESQPKKPEWEVMPEGPEEEAPESSGEATGQVEEAPARPAYTGKTPGEMLREAREARNLSIQDVVTQTRMTAETIRALEEDRDPPQNAWVYVRGYYRKYARSLGLSDDEVLEAHERYVGGAPEPEPVSAEWAPQDVSPAAAMPRFMVVLVIGILAGGLLWWLVPQLASGPETTEGEVTEQADTGQSLTGNTFENRQKQPQTRSAQPETAGQPEPAAPSLSIFSGAENERQGEEEAESAEAETATADEVGDGAVESAASDAAVATTGPLVLIFKERSWVNIVDANNSKLLDGIVGAGKQHALDGQPPFRVFLGYAPGVEVVYKGQPVDTAPHTSSNNTARFKVGEQNDTETSATP